MTYTNFEQYKSETGWEDWMGDYLDSLGMPSPEDDELNDVQVKMIDEELYRRFLKQLQ